MSQTEFKVILTMSPGDERNHIEHDLAELGYSVRTFETGNDLWSYANTHRTPHALLMDTDVSGADTEELLEAILENKLPIRTLLLTDEHTANMAAVWSSLGAWCYLLKPINWGLLTLNFERIADFFRSRSETESLRACLSSLAAPLHPAPFSGTSMPALRETISHLARGASPVLIHGEHGIDRKAFAYELHVAGPRKKNAFVAVRSSLFIHGDPRLPVDPVDRLMRAAAGAHNGTLFIDEISTLPRPIQEQLLALLKNRDAAGNSDAGNGDENEAPPPRDFRLVAATSVNLALEVGKGTFIEELFTLLNHRTISIPPLRERAADIPELARNMLLEASQNPSHPKEISDAAIDILAHYYWPGNERELRNVVERAAAHTQSQVLLPEDILALISFAPPEHIEQALPKDDFNFPSLALPLCDIEKEYIARVLAKNEFHRERTAASLGISRKTLYLKIKEYNLKRPAAKKHEPQEEPEQ